MSQMIPHVCPNITCRAFGQAFELECTDDPPYGDGYYEAVCDDEDECGCCPCHGVPVEMFERALKDVRAGSGI